MIGFNYRNKWDRLPGACFQLLVRPLVFLKLKLFFGLSVEGLDHLKDYSGDKSVIIAANHIHELDGFLLPAAIPLHHLPEPLHPVTRESSFYKDKGIRGKIYSHGLIFYLMGAFPAYAGQDNYHQSLFNHINILNDGGAVLIFPEGKARDYRMKAKGGIGYLSIHTQTPVVPIHIDWSNMKERDATITIGTPLKPPTPLSTSDTIEIAKLFSEKVLSTIYQLSN